MASGDEWLFDSVLGFLKSPDWALPVMAFIDDNCVVFYGAEENELYHTEIHASFKDMVESLLNFHLEEMGVTQEQFVSVCTSASKTDAGREAIEQILAVDDFVSFKQMMVKRNMELELEAMEGLQEAVAQTEGGGEAPAAQAGEEEDEEAVLAKVLALSLEEAKKSGHLEGPTQEEIDKKRAEKEEQDLKHAIALSLQIEEMAKAEAESAAAAPPPPAAPPPRAVPAALPAVKPPAAVAARPAPLAPVSAAPTPTLQDIRVSEAAAKAAEARKLGEAAKEQQQQKLLAGQPDNLKDRAKHLREQRDLILAKRKKQREKEAETYVPPADTTPAPAAGPSSMRSAAGFGSEPKKAEDAKARMVLSHALCSNMKSNLNGDSSFFGEKEMVKADLEATKAALRAEAEAARKLG